MRNLLNCLIIVFCVLQFACKRNKQQQRGFDFKPPQTVEAKSYNVPAEKVAPPEIIPAIKIKSKIVSKPKVIPFKSNEYQTGRPKSVISGSPRICIPGQDGFQLPEIVTAIDSSFAAGNPEITIAKDPHVNDNSPVNFSSFKVQQGLKTNIIFPIMHDKAGNLWIACYEGGVCKYDGKTFANYTMAQGLSSDLVWSMLEDSKGNLWFGCLNGGGLNKFDGKSFTHYTTRQGLSDNAVISMLEDKEGNLWFGTEKSGINKYDGKTFTHYSTLQGLVNNHVRSIIQDSKGDLWLGTDGGLSKFDGNSFTNYTTNHGLSNASVNSIAEDSNNNLWISTNGGGINKFDGVYFHQYTTEQGLQTNTLWSILKDRTGNLWFGSLGNGLIKYDGTSFTQFTTEQGLINNSVHSIIEDRAGNIWIGTDHGLSKYQGTAFTHFTPGMGFNEGNYFSIREDQAGNLWAGTIGGGVIKFDGKTITHYTKDQGLINNNITCLLNDSTDIWIGTHMGGLNKYDGNSIIQFKNFSFSVWSMLTDSNGNKWFGTGKGLYKYDGKNFTRFGVAQGLSGESIVSICEDRKGNLWLGIEYDSIVNKLDLSAAETGRYSITHYNVHQGAIASIYSIKEDNQNNLWFGTSNAGVIKFDGSSFTRYTTAQGLSNNSVNSIVQDKDDNLWFLTSNGLCKMRCQENRKEAKEIPEQRSVSLFTNYLYADGFLGLGGFYNSLILGRDGSIWAGTDNRITSYHPERDIPDTIPPQVQLSSILLFDENINWLDLNTQKNATLILGNGTSFKNFSFSDLTPWHNQPQNLQLAYNNNYVTFQFIGTTTNRPKEVRYKYFLEGLDKQWSSLISIPEATYNNLPPGTYTFKVKAVNSEGYWSNELSYPFVIRPPRWLTWWAYVCYGLVFTTSICLFIRYRSRRLKQQNLALEEKVNKRTTELEQSLQEKYELNKKIESQQALLNERLRISRELHDDIGSTLGSISIYSEVARKRTQKNENANEVLSKIGLASRELIDKMSDIVWSLNPGNETFEQLQDRMMAFAAMMLAPRNILYDFIADEELKTIRLTSEQRKNIFLIFKEALYNIVKYAGCKNVHISLAAQANGVAMTIQDDGKGFDLYLAATNEVLSNGEYLGGNGIKNMKARAGDMNAEFCIDSKVNVGTTIQLIINL